MLTRTRLPVLGQTNTEGLVSVGEKCDCGTVRLGRGSAVALLYAGKS